MLYFNSKKQKHIDYNTFASILVVRGQDYLDTLLLQNFSNKFSKSNDINIYKQKPTFFWLNFANISLDALLKLYRVCKENNYSSAIIFVKNKDKKYYQFSRYFDGFIFEFESYKLFFNKLKSTHSLPTTNAVKKTKLSATLLLILKSAFCKRNCKHFLFTAFFILLMSFITPLKTYYLIMAGIATLCAVICLFMPV